MGQGLFDLSGRLALVTGASRGLGLAMARGLAEAGARVVLNGRDQGRLAAAAAPLVGTGLSAETAAFDVSDSEAVEREVGAIEARLGPISILVNNAGINHRVNALNMPDEIWREVLATNLDAPFWAARSVGRRMVARGTGKVINISSIAGLAALRGGNPSYGASKAALHALTRSLCAEWAGRGVQVNCIAPGAFATEMTGGDENRVMSEWVRSRTPAGRWGRPEDLIGTVVFLAAPASDFVNGQVIAVDGGLVAVL